MSTPAPLPTADNADRGVNAIVCFWLQASLAMIVVGLRFFARYLVKSVGWDDWTMLFTLLLFIVWCCVLTLYATLGGFRHLDYLLATNADIERITEVNYIVQIIVIFAYAPAKTAVGILVARIIGPAALSQHKSWRKWLLYVTLAIVWITSIINSIVTYAQCDPPEALWNPNIPHNCWAPDVEPDIGMGAASFNVFADAVLAFLPASVIYNLKMDLKRRVNLCILLSLGAFAGVCGIIKVTYIPTLEHKADITWNTYCLITWAGSELFVLILCGSIPTIKPVWDRFILKKMYRSTNDDGGYKVENGLSNEYGLARTGNSTNIGAWPKSVDSLEGSMTGLKDPTSIRTQTEIEIISSEEWASSSTRRHSPPY